MKPTCVLCGKTVLVSKQVSSEGSSHPITGAKGHCHWHNECATWEREREALNKLIGLCGGDVALAKKIRARILGVPGALALWKRNRDA